MDCIDQTLRCWNQTILVQHFDQSSIEKIVRIPLSSAISSNRRAWDLSRDGRFSTKSAYLALRGGNRTHDNLWKKFWKIKLPHRVQLFVWKCILNGIPVRDFLSQRINLDSNLCPYYNMMPETTMHAILICPHVRNDWLSSPLRIRTDRFTGTGIRDWVSLWHGEKPYTEKYEYMQKFPLVACIMWSIWMSRNTLIHAGKTDSHEVIINRALAYLPQLPHSTYCSIF
ncbi:Reverse transcriptase zinc-binding domain [Macleaya cordata]|uniref:Reverse transcriptase zinc-binding domain n=1 Tax=Macleaya cordata TaxID=56857 RepID=A0A200Q4X9_MACCD|nr:Reverse transcriptase zinc-binding domain [Macleaya cordata]